MLTPTASEDRPSAANRLRASGSTHASAGDPVMLDYATLKVFRGPLRNVLGLGAIGQQR
jgi:hypothetical protein